MTAELVTAGMRIQDIAGENVGVFIGTFGKG